MVWATPKNTVFSGKNINTCFRMQYWWLCLSLYEIFTQSSLNDLQSTAWNQTLLLLLGCSGDCSWKQRGMMDMLCPAVCRLFARVFVVRNACTHRPSAFTAAFGNLSAADILKWGSRTKSNLLHFSIVEQLFLVHIIFQCNCINFYPTDFWNTTLSRTVILSQTLPLKVDSHKKSVLVYWSVKIVLWEGCWTIFSFWNLAWIEIQPFRPHYLARSDFLTTF